MPDEEEVEVVHTFNPLQSEIEVVTNPIAEFQVASAPSAYTVVEVVTEPVAEFRVEVPGTPGPRGYQGPPGEPSVGATVEYQFPVPLLVWEGSHPYLGKPVVILLDEDEEEFIGRVSHPRTRYHYLDPDHGIVLVRFSVPCAGTLVIRA